MAADGNTRTSSLNIREEILNKIEERQLPWTKAHVELGVTRQTLYSWCGQHSFVPPSPRYAQSIAEFIEQPVDVVLEELLRLDAARFFDTKHFDVEVTVRRRASAPSSISHRAGVRGSATSKSSPRPSRSSTTPGYVRWGGHGYGELSLVRAA